MPERSAQIAILGDLHSAWHPADVEWFNRSDYELLLFTGDLGGSAVQNGLEIARSIANLERRALVMLGNNDVEQYAAISAELTYRRGLAGLLETTATNAGALTCGYSAHPLELTGLTFTLIAARPFAMGGSEVSFAEALTRSYGVRTLQESRERLQQLVEAAPHDHLVFLAHNGPTGLGATASDPWGRDFGEEQGDFGDIDLADAVAFARAKGKRVLAVIAGHMHWPSRRYGERRWCVERDGTLYVNAARVPRIVAARGKSVRQHLALALDTDGASVREVFVETT